MSWTFWLIIVFNMDNYELQLHGPPHYTLEIDKYAVRSKLITL